MALKTLYKNDMGKCRDIYIYYVTLKLSYITTARGNVIYSSRLFRKAL